MQEFVDIADLWVKTVSDPKADKKKSPTRKDASKSPKPRATSKKGARIYIRDDDFFKDDDKVNDILSGLKKKNPEFDYDTSQGHTNKRKLKGLGKYRNQA